MSRWKAFSSCNIHGYNFDSTCDIYNDIIQVIDILQNELLEREHKLELQKIKKQSGLYIDNLISKVNYNNNYLKNHIVLFTDNANTFNNFHKTYLARFLVKTKLFHGQINYDIKLEESKNSIDCKLSDVKSIILEEDEENEIRNLINITDNSGKDVPVDTKNNIINELNCMISGISDSTSNSNSNSISNSNSNSNIDINNSSNIDTNSNISYSPVSDLIIDNSSSYFSVSPEKLERDNTVSDISIPIQESEVSIKNEIIVKLEKDIDKIIDNENKEDNNQEDNNNELKCNYINCILM